MLIKKLQIQNFKSFNEKQSITAGIKNVIIGKNGSGKSNLLTALATTFLFTSEKRPQYNNNDGDSIVEIEVDNSDRRFLLPTNFVLRAKFRDSLEFTINDKPVTQVEFRGLLENAGFTPECFVMQGKVNDIAMMNSKDRFRLISRIAGVEKYEESKSIAMKLLNEENEEKVEALIEKIEMKMKISEGYKKKAEEYDALCKEKAEAEFELMNYELKELNEEIEKIVINEENKKIEKDEGLLEYEIKSCKDTITHLWLDVEEAKEFIDKFDQSIVTQIKEKLRENSFENPYDHKVSVLEKAKKETHERLIEIERKEQQKYIDLKALKYLNAAGSVREDISVLEDQLKIKREEIRNFNGTVDSKESYRSMISERKALWIKEKHLKDELKNLKEQEKNTENKILYLGKLSINVYETIKTREGVVGTVFSLFDVPDRLLDAFEAVTRNSLFWIVVENEDVATKLIEGIDGRVTFVALNRIKHKAKGKAPHENLERLSDQVHCEERFQDLLNMICREYFVAPDQKSALELSEKHGINVVTVDGDIFSKNGSITGGYEGSNQILRDLKCYKKRICELEKELRAITQRIATISDKIKYCEMANDDDNRILDNLKAVEKYLILKIELLKHGKISVPDVASLEIEYNHISANVPKVRLDVESIEGQLSRASEKKAKIDEVVQKIRFVNDAQHDIELYQTKEKELIDSMYDRKPNENLDESTKLQKKHLLIDKRTHLMKRIGISDFRAIFIRKSREELMASLKEVNKKLKGFYGFSKKEHMDDQRIELRQKLEELKTSKQNILDFISTLDQKKEDTFNLSFSMISDNYSFFFKTFTDRTSNLLLRNESIDLLIDGVPCDVGSMSGGQKTVIALSLIFAIQKNDPSPFYVFDEIDANLDIQHCERLRDIIKQSTSQYFITSFKPEIVDACDKFFGVVSRERESFVDEISKDVAFESIKP